MLTTKAMTLAHRAEGRTDAMPVELIEGRDAAAFASAEVKATTERAIQVLRDAESLGGPLSIDFGASLMKALYGQSDAAIASEGRHVRFRRATTNFTVAFAPYEHRSWPFSVRSDVTRRVVDRFKSVTQALKKYPYARVSGTAARADEARRSRGIGNEGGEEEHG